MMVVATDNASAAPGVVDHYNITAVADQTAGTGFSALVSAVDSDGVLVPTATTTVQIAIYIESTVNTTSHARLYLSDYTTIAPSNQPLVGGQLTIFIKDNVTETVYIVISSASLAGASGNIIINPAPIDYYVVASTTPQVAGVGWSGTATGYDVFDNQVYTDDTTVVTMTQDGSAVFYTSATYTTSGNTYAVSAGIATFYVRDIVAPQTLALNATDENGKTGEIADIFVNYAPIDHFGVLVGDEPIEKIAGELWTANTNDVVVTARDEFGNFVDNYTGTPEWSASCDGSLPDSQAFVAGTYTFDGDEFSLNIAGEQIITMTDGEITGSSTNITIIPAEIDYYVVASTTPQIAGMGWSGTVTAYDEFDNQVYTDNTTVVTMSNNGSAVFYTNATYATSGNTYTLTAGVATFYVRDIVAETITLTVTDGNSKTGYIADIVVLPADLDHFTITGYPGSTIAGVSFDDDVIVTAYDEFNNVKTNYEGTVTWTSSDVAPYPADLPGNYTFTVGDAGVHSFDGTDFVLYTTDSQTITVTDTVNAVTLTSEAIEVLPAAIDYLIIASTTPQVAGVGWSGNVTAYDEFDNVVTTNSTTVVTMHTYVGTANFYTNDTYGIETPGNNYTLSAGVATFYAMTTVAYTYLPMVMAATGGGATEGLYYIYVNPAAIDHYVVASTTPQVAGVGWSGTVTAYDEFDNVVTTNSTTVVTMSNNGSAVFYTNATYATSGNTYTLTAGVATFYVRDTVAETITLTVTDGNSKTGSIANIVVNAAAIEYYMVSYSSPQVAGVGWSGTATAYDFFGNRVILDSTTVVTMSNDGSAVFYTSDTYATPGNTYTLSAGIATFYVRDIVAETITLTATDGNSKTGDTPAGIVVNPASINYYVITSTTPQVAGVGWNGTVTAYDEFDNVVTTDSSTHVMMSDIGSAVFYTDDTCAIPDYNYTLSSGVATFYAMDTVAETLFLMVVDDTAFGASGYLEDIVVLPTALDHFTMTGCPASTIAGESFDDDVVVTAYDRYDNVKTNYEGTVTWTSSDPYPADLPGNYTFTVGDAGAHNFAGANFVLYKTASQTITVTDTVDAVTLTSEAIEVLPADIDYYVVASTTPQVAGVGWSGTVTAYDEFDNVVTTDSTTVVTMTNSGSAVFYTDGTYATPGNNYTLSAGVATFYVRDTVAETITLTATDGNSKTGYIADIVVLPAAIDYFVMINYPAVTYAGAAFVASITVTAYDRYDNVKTNYEGTVTWTSSDPYPADLPGDYTFVIGDAGVHTFAGADFVLYTTPYQMITVTDTVDGVTLTSVPILMLVDDRPIDIVMDVGTIHFPGEIVAWWMLMTVNGHPFDPTTMVATLYAPDLSTTDLSEDMYMITTGLWMVNWTIPGDALAGQYTLVLTVNDGFSYGSSLRTFVISATLIDMNARIVSMDGNITLVQTDIGLIQLDLTDISAMATSINGTLVTIQTSIGNIEADISDIDGRLTNIEGDIATIQTDIGTIQVDITAINAYIASINGTLVTIQTDIGTIQVDIADIDGRLTDIEGDIATIQTDIGTIQVDIANINVLAASMNGTLVTIQTDIGTIQVDIANINVLAASMNGTLVMMQTSIGNIEADISDIDGRLTNIEGDIATIQTDIGTIQVDITAINAYIASINGTLVTIQTDIGAIQVDIADIETYIASINGTLATIQTDIGTIQVDITAINAYIASINGTLVTIQTDIGTIKVSITAINGRLTTIDGNIATITTDIGVIKVSITAINGRLTTIDGNIATITTDIGAIKTNLTNIGAYIESINGTLVIIQTDIGAIKVNLTAINATVVSIQGTVATIQTSLGTLTGNVTSVRGNIATIQTELGVMEGDIAGLQTETQSGNTYGIIALVLLIISIVLGIICVYGLRRRRFI